MSELTKVFVLLLVVLAVSGIACATNSTVTSTGKVNQELADNVLKLLQDKGYEAQVLVEGNHLYMDVEAFDTETAFGVVGYAAGITAHGSDDPYVTIHIKDAYTRKTSVIEVDHKTGIRLYYAFLGHNDQESSGILEQLIDNIKVVRS